MMMVEIAGEARRRACAGGDGWRRAAAALAIVAAPLVPTAPSPARAADFDSAYSRLDLAACRAERPAADDPLTSGIWWCTGHAGIPVRVVESDLRFLVSYGAGAADEVAAGQTLPAFNTIGETLEWRLRRTGGGWQPFATILRFHTDSGDGRRGQVLVVTRLGPPGSVCHVAYVDATANAEANSLARQAADERAEGFRCDIDEPQWVGMGGPDQ